MLTHAPGALRCQAGYSPKTARFYRVVCAVFGHKTTQLLSLERIFKEKNLRKPHKVIDNGIAFLNTEEQLA